MLILVRLQLEDRPGALASAAGAIADAGGDIVAMDVVERATSKVTDDFVVEWGTTSSENLEQLQRRLGEVPGVVAVDCARPTPQAELHRELELLTSLASEARPSLDRLDLLARLTPAILRCDWAAVLSSSGSAIGMTHASAGGPRTRWTSLPWWPLSAATALELDERWVPAAWHGQRPLALSAAPIDRQRALLACRTAGPPFLAREVTQLGALGALAGRLLPPPRPGPAPRASWHVTIGEAG